LPTLPVARAAVPAILSKQTTVRPRWSLPKPDCDWGRSGDRRVAGLH